MRPRVGNPSSFSRSKFMGNGNMGCILLTGNFHKQNDTGYLGFFSPNFDHGILSVLFFFPVRKKMRQNQNGRWNGCPMMSNGCHSKMDHWTSPPCFPGVGKCPHFSHHPNKTCRYTTSAHICFGDVQNPPTLETKP